MGEGQEFKQFQGRFQDLKGRGLKKNKYKGEIPGFQRKKKKSGVWGVG